MFPRILVQIYKPLQTNGIIFRNVRGQGFIVKIYWDDCLLVFILMVLGIIVAKVNFFIVPVDIELIFGIHSLGTNKISCRWILISFG